MKKILSCIAPKTTDYEHSRASSSKNEHCSSHKLNSTSLRMGSSIQSRATDNIDTSASKSLSSTWQHASSPLSKRSLLLPDSSLSRSYEEKEKKSDSQDEKPTNPVLNLFILAAVHGQGTENRETQNNFSSITEAEESARPPGGPLPYWVEQPEEDNSRN